MNTNDHEKAACTPRPLHRNGFNPNCVLPHGVTVDHVKAAMQEYIGFLGFINNQLNTRQIPRLESFLMPANFSSIVGEFVTVTIPKHCPAIAKNTYHNGHPDLVPKGMFPDDSVLHASEGIEVKASRYMKGWQGHNAENVFLTVLCFEASRATDKDKGVAPIPFNFVKVVAAELEEADWKFAGRSATSRRTITASVIDSGFQKMEANWVYRDLDHDENAAYR